MIKISPQRIAIRFDDIALGCSGTNLQHDSSQNAPSLDACMRLGGLCQGILRCNRHAEPSLGHSSFQTRELARAEAILPRSYRGCFARGGGGGGRGIGLSLTTGKGCGGNSRSIIGPTGLPALKLSSCGGSSGRPGCSTMASRVDVEGRWQRRRCSPRYQSRRRSCHWMSWRRDSLRGTSPRRRLRAGRLG